MPLLVLLVWGAGTVASSAGVGHVRVAAWVALGSTAGLAALLFHQQSLAHRRVVHRLECLASTDALTGLANRRLFLDALARCIDPVGARPTAVVLVDIDMFKLVNDELGHDAGDQVLVAVARELAARCRSDDIVARLGGEEFAVLLPGTGVMCAERVADAMCAAVRAIQRTPVTISCGVAGLLPSDTCPRDVLVRADAALYDAKRLGRDRVVVAGGTTE